MSPVHAASIVECEERCALDLFLADGIGGSPARHPGIGGALGAVAGNLDGV
jgi:hypothetical protein